MPWWVRVSCVHQLLCYAAWLLCDDVWLFSNSVWMFLTHVFDTVCLFYSWSKEDRNNSCNVGSRYENAHTFKTRHYHVLCTSSQIAAKLNLLLYQFQTPPLSYRCRADSLHSSTISRATSPLLHWSTNTHGSLWLWSQQSRGHTDAIADTVRLLATVYYHTEQMVIT